ncbi:tetratricopeptide repeat protein [uncultured Alistipes sp.]|uniref:tetratricopeptide repeat protein n=2 Tax=uncultured Alistipes sp. TaxID=538949 RepID=UPI0026EC1138|nr:tetratricopeptide repeat protein [uncultured Alistipes sp.]
MKRILTTVCLLGAVCGTAAAQKYPERRHIRSGNGQYEKGDYTGAEVSYLRALEKTPDSYESAFNLADALYKQKRYDEAAEICGRLAADSLHGQHAARAWFNRGNALFQQRKLEEALEAYKNSMRLDPDDMEAKFNYAYTKKLLEKEKDDPNRDQDKNQDKNENKDQNEDRNGNDKNPNDDRQQPNGDNGENDKKNDDENKDENKDDRQPGDNRPDDAPDGEGQQPPQPQGMNREEAERMLDAIQSSENDTKKKVDGRKARAVGRSGKNW